MKELKEQGATKLVLDLRGNGGGLLREAVNIVNLFVPKNELVVETKGQDPRMGQDLQDLERTHGREHSLGGAGGWPERQRERDRERGVAGPGPRGDRG
jgi:hypothetical protein